MTMTAAALKHLEYRTGDPNPDIDAEYDERDSDSASYELLVSGQPGCLTIRYFYDAGHAGVTILVEDVQPSEDPEAVARKVVDHARECAKKANSW